MADSLPSVTSLPSWLWLSDAARRMGIHIQAGKGSGKSRLMGRMIAWHDFLKGIPVVILDPVGETIDNFLDKIIRSPRHWQERLWPRVHYIDMSGKGGFVYPFPLYYKLGGESLREVAKRYVDVVGVMDPYLRTASIEGWNAFSTAATNIGMVLAALNLQITEAFPLLRNPVAWEDQILPLEGRYPELAEPIAFLQLLADEKLSLSNRQRLIGSLVNKIAMFSLDPTLQAMFGANDPIDWYKETRLRSALLFDFRHLQNDTERRHFTMLWVFYSLLNFVKHRGKGRRNIPISFIIDELSAMLSVQALTADAFASEMDDFLNVIARNYGMWVTIAHQELFQLTLRMQKTLMTMGTQVLGRTDDPEGAEFSARQFFRFDPLWGVEYVTRWGGDVRAFTPEVQFLLHSAKFLDQQLFHFLVRPADAEGKISTQIYPVSIANYDRDQFPLETLVAMARERLMETRGLPVPRLLAEIGTRKRGSAVQPLGLPSSDKQAEQATFWVG